MKTQTTHCKCVLFLLKLFIIRHLFKHNGKSISWKHIEDLYITLRKLVKVLQDE